MNPVFRVMPGAGVPVGFDLPRPFQQAELALVPVLPMREMLEHYLAAGREGRLPAGVAPLLLGPARSWKTYASCALARQLCRMYVYFASGPDLAFRLDNRAFGASTQAYLTQLLNARFLLLDDFTAIQGTRAGTFFAQLVSHRFNSALPTLFTGNLQRTEQALETQLDALYGPLVARRIVDMSKGYQLLL